MNEMNQEPVSDLDQLKKKALFFVWVGEIWNLIEAAVALWSGIGAGSVALIGFGLDSILELAAGGILIWRMQTTWQDHDERTPLKERPTSLSESRFLYLPATSFFNPQQLSLVILRNLKRARSDSYSLSPAPS